MGNRVATKVNDEWRFMVYDAFGKMVAEYGNEEPDITRIVEEFVEGICPYAYHLNPNIECPGFD